MKPLEAAAHTLWATAIITAWMIAGFWLTTTGRVTDGGTPAMWMLATPIAFTLAALPLILRRAL
ncbi:hypothetical protein [Timonella senegalensis]|uniref:hypothetical protein n=1 Tax=Timonella senegalensis TaxID=1465825 RepID=UPI002FDE505D